jgi:hypothetical protein
MIGKPTGDQNIGTMTFGIDMILLGEIVALPPQKAIFVQKRWNKRIRTHHQLRNSANPGAGPVENFARGRLPESPRPSLFHSRACGESTINL